MASGCFRGRALPGLSSDLRAELLPLHGGACRLRCFYPKLVRKVRRKYTKAFVLIVGLWFERKARPLAARLRQILYGPDAEEGCQMAMNVCRNLALLFTPALCLSSCASAHRLVLSRSGAEGEGRDT